MLREFVETMKIAIDTVVEREGLRTSAHDFFSERSETSTKVPQLVLTGGGYGAGKTSVVESFLKEGAVNLTERSMMGADLCRDLIPEYSQIISVLDSRGGEVCQEESYLLLNRLLDRLLETKRSFIWDSTLQYTDRANEIIRKARDHEFEIYLLAVTVDPFRALERAFERAVKIRRFLKSEALIKSHRRFAKNLPILISQVDFAYVHDSTIEDETPRMIAKKEGFEAELEVIDPEAYNLALERGSDE
jgi:predicted ABC-type ATPase